MTDLEKHLQRWVGAQLIDTVTANRILEFEKGSGQGKLRWPAILAIGFGAVMLCAGILLFVAAHWGQLSPGQRFGVVVAMVAVFPRSGRSAWRKGSSDRNRPAHGRDLLPGRRNLPCSTDFPFAGRLAQWHSTLVRWSNPGRAGSEAMAASIAGGGAYTVVVDRRVVAGNQG